MPSNLNTHSSGTKSSKPNVSNPATNTNAQANSAANPSISSLDKLHGNKFSGSAAATQLPNTTPGQQSAATTGNSADNVGSGVNKKKQKRRQKQAARLAAEQPPATKPNLAQAINNKADIAYQNTYQASTPHSRVQANGFDYGASGYDDSERYEPVTGEDLYFTDEEGRLYHNENAFGQIRTNGHMADGSHPEAGGKAKKKKKSKGGSATQLEYQPDQPPSNPIPPSNKIIQPPPPPPPPLSTAALHSAHHISKDRIWNTSTAEERERIKEFWLSLGEEDRRSLVKVEKEAVLKKMKEQQKHSCSCTVCGRKRTAIEEELEVLYDAYYEELEQYANNQHINLENGTPIIPHPRMYAHPMAHIPSRNPQAPNNQRSSDRIQEVDEDDDDGDEEDYSEEDEDDELSEEEPEELPPGPAADFFNFGNSLTVQGMPNPPAKSVLR